MQMVPNTLQACTLIASPGRTKAKEQAEVINRMEAVGMAEVDVVVAEARPRDRVRRETMVHVPCMPSKEFHAPMVIIAVTSKHGQLLPFRPSPRPRAAHLTLFSQALPRPMQDPVLSEQPPFR